MDKIPRPHKSDEVMNIENEFKNLLDEFSFTVKAIAGVYFDAIQGFALNLKEIDKFQSQFIQQTQSQEPEEVLLQQLDSAWILRGEGDPNNAKAVVYHQTTQRDFKTSNSEGGTNYTFIGNMALIAIYQYWEDRYRQSIADILAVDKNQIQSNIFGDMRILRHCIIHHNGVASPEVGKCKVLHWFKPGESIMIQKRKFIELLNNLKRLDIIVAKESRKKRNCSDTPDANAS